MRIPLTSRTTSLNVTSGRTAPASWARARRGSPAAKIAAWHSLNSSDSMPIVASSSAASAFFVTSSGFLLAARAGQGIGGALAAPSALALLTTMFAEGRERMRALGLYTAVSIGGSAVGLVAGGMLTQWVSWRWVLFVNVPIGIAVLVLGRAVLPETPRHEGRFDLIGALTSTLGMGSLVYGFVRAASDGWGDELTLAAFAAGVSCSSRSSLRSCTRPHPSRLCTC